MTLQRPPPPPLVWAKNWAERLNDYLTQVRTRLPAKASVASAKEEGMLLYDRIEQLPVYTKNNSFVSLVARDGTADLVFTPTTQPSSPVNGMVYYDSSTNKLRVYANGVWVNLH